MQTNQLTPAARTFLEETTMQSILGIPEDALEAVRAIAFQLHQSDRNAEVEVLCRGLVAANHRHAWSYSLLAAALRRQGKLSAARDAVDEGLSHLPGDSKLQFMRTELGQAISQARTLGLAAEPIAIDASNPVA